jgi:hypothetical protein
MIPPTLVPELNVYTNKVLRESFNINKKYLNYAPLDEIKYKDFMSTISFQKVLFGWSYDYSDFGIYYEILDPLVNADPALYTRMNIYGNAIKVYLLDKDANRNIPIKYDSSSEVSIDIIPLNYQHPRSYEFYEMGFNVFNITFDEYYFLERMKEIKSGYDTTGFLDFEVKPRCDLSKMIYQYLECECLNKYPNSIFTLSPDNNRILDRLFQQWLVNYFYVKKQLTEVQKLNAKTHFYIPNTNSKIFILTNEIISRGYLELPEEPINVEHTKFFYKNTLIVGNHIMTEDNVVRFYWNSALTQEMKNEERVYLAWSFIQYPLEVNI